MHIRLFRCICTIVKKALDSEKMLIQHLEEMEADGVQRSGAPPIATPTESALSISRRSPQAPPPGRSPSPSGGAGSY
jgi:hypothetical protein